MDFSVVICAFSGGRWRDIGAALDSVRQQTVSAREVILVIDHNVELLRRARHAYPDILVLDNEHTRGLSGARNTGVSAATADVVAFLDDDARADDRWLERLGAAYEDPRTVGAGGAVEPAWRTGRPRWFPPEFDWVVGCSHSGMPQTSAPVRNPVGANMSFRRDALVDLRGFRDGIGRTGSLPVGCEETELSIRLHHRWPDLVTLYVPDARVRHTVTPERTTIGYFLYRCYAEGRSKATVARLVGARDGLEAERTYLRRTLPAGVLRGLRGAIRRRAGFGAAMAIVAGLATTTLGYVTEALRRPPRRTGDRQGDMTPLGEPTGSR